MMADNYEHLRVSLNAVMTDLSILAGDVIGPSGETWQSISHRVGLKLQALGLEYCATSRTPGGLTCFPSPAEALEDAQHQQYARFKVQPMRCGVKHGNGVIRRTLKCARRLAEQHIGVHPHDTVEIWGTEDASGTPGKVLHWHVIERLGT